MNNQSKNNQSISRKEALQEIRFYGKYIALTMVGTYIMLNPHTAQAASPESPGSGF